MQLVIDANILFAAFIKDGITAEILLSPYDQFFAPEFILDEFYKHKNEILKKTKRMPEEFDLLFEILKEKIEVVPKEDYTSKMKEAETISPDADDVPYVALALKLKIPIWSNDRELKEKQDVVKVYNTKDTLQ